MIEFLKNLKLNILFKMTDDAQSFWYKKCQFFKSTWMLYKKENDYESIHVSCFKRKLRVDIKYNGADFGYLNVSTHVVCFLKVFLAGKHDFYIQAKVIYNL